MNQEKYSISNSNELGDAAALNSAEQDSGFGETYNSKQLLDQLRCNAQNNTFSLLGWQKIHSPEGMDNDGVLKALEKYRGKDISEINSSQIESDSEAAVLRLVELGVAVKALKNAYSTLYKTNSDFVTMQLGDKKLRINKRKDSIKIFYSPSVGD